MCIPPDNIYRFETHPHISNRKTIGFGWFWGPPILRKHQTHVTIFLWIETGPLSEQKHHRVSRVVDVDKIPTVWE